VRLRIGREDVVAAEGTDVGVRVEVDGEPGSALGDNMGGGTGGAPTPGDGTKMIEIVAISTKKNTRSR
jgi:hypothetical protein